MLLQIVYNHEPVSTIVTFLLYLTTGKNSSGDLRTPNYPTSEFRAISASAWLGLAELRNLVLSQPGWVMAGAWLSWVLAELSNKGLPPTTIVV